MPCDLYSTVMVGNYKLWFADKKQRAQLDVVCYEPETSEWYLDSSITADMMV